MTEEIDTKPALAEMTAALVAAYVARNAVPTSEMPGLIRSVHTSLSGLGSTKAPEAPAQLTPAVPVRKSVTDDYIVSLEDGRRFKSLKRHLATEHGMTPQEYRAKWGLPKDYPMVAPAYAKARSELARSMQLGRKRAAAPEPAPQPEPEAAAPAPKRGGRRKAA